MLKLLYIGNSFSMDILEHAVDIAHDLGISDIKIGDMYYPSCSLKMHLNHALNDEAKYTPLRPGVFQSLNFRWESGDILKCFFYY